MCEEREDRMNTDGVYHHQDNNFSLQLPQLTPGRSSSLPPALRDLMANKLAVQQQQGRNQIPFIHSLWNERRGVCVGASSVCVNVCMDHCSYWEWLLPLTLISTHHHQSLLLLPTLAPGWLGGNMLYGQCRSKRTMDSGEKKGEEKKTKKGTTTPPPSPSSCRSPPETYWILDDASLSFFPFPLLHCNSPLFFFSLNLHTVTH